ncbi:sigma 54-interacting transcriptional regulator [Duganella sp. LX20W]|uniref:Sigma 54-interacting transcriptional regulator n=1 Tax=Rugamonas brunnea TaxID=2758569 RepID=A0A7W2ENH0_9BURK|nr:sigma-54-dependent Fis family transcriptional regulator [Rugamonas brunnea]MBA5635585.1 sigma 54-interacting transcriptional regulator [Rugamonas brunnea]
MGKNKALSEVFNLRSRLRFDTANGNIWLDESRMMLLHTRAFGALRKELFDSLGVERARGLLVRMGFVAGQQDGELAKKLAGDRPLADIFLLGPEIHGLEGVVKTRTVRCDLDFEHGNFYGEFTLDNSWEAESHLQTFGVDKEHACWSVIGYASGYVTAFMNRLIVFRETACHACGEALCYMVGKNAEEWDEEYLRYFQPENIAEQMIELQQQVTQLRATLESARGSDNMVGESAAFRAAFSLLKKAALSPINVLLLGETGVGKERFARWLHENGPRADKPFIAVNCAAIPHDLIEAELFGVTKGAYTGAEQSRPGRFERANGGTLFLDEIGDLAPAAQVKLLRVLQTGEVERLGDDHARKVDVRLVSATNVNLQQAISTGKFRADLYYRLATYPVTIPPLRERPTDLPLLVDSFIEKFSALYPKKVLGVTERAMQMLSQYSWPGNIRELENVIERGVLLVPPGGRIEAGHLFAEQQQFVQEGEGIDLEGHLPERSAAREQGLCEELLGPDFNLIAHENALVDLAVKKANGNLSQAARLLGITRRQLAYKFNRSGD